MNINCDHYKHFYYAARYGSFTQAASMLYLNQPNLTRSIKTLEGELGCTLFIRSNKGVTLTEEGERLYEHIRVAMEHIEAAEEEFTQSRSLECGVVSIGASEIALRGYLLPILNSYREKYPGVRIKIANASTPQALSMLEESMIDIAVVSTPLEADDLLAVSHLMSFKEVPVCGEAYYERTRNLRSLEELAVLPIISLGEKTSTYKYYLHLFSEAGLKFSPDIEAATADQILPLVEHNLGVGFVPEEFLEGVVGVYRLDAQLNLPTRDICLVKKRSHKMTPPARELERLILHKKM